MTVRLYIGNLPEEVDRQALEDLFTAAGEVVSTKIIRDRKTGKCRGFGFLTVNTPEQADAYIEKFNGQDFEGITLKIELAQPRAKSGDGGEGDDALPTPKPTTAQQRSGGQGGGGKKRNRNRSQGSVTSTSSSTPSGPDPRWASQLQRIKEQLQATNQ